ncbi:MAG: NACHT domain-containing protein [Acidobacteria bacterium]|nr:NACHT domain-containing protein [Acidobacteriota bacterium]
MSVAKRLQETKSLWDILPKGTEGGKEFARVVDLLRFHEARRAGRSITLYSDAAGDFHGLDGFEDSPAGHVGFQYKFIPSPFTPSHRAEIEKSLAATQKAQKKLKLKKWILVTPQDATQSATRKDGGDVTWLEGLKQKLKLPFAVEHWGHRSLQSLFLQVESICLYYYPELLDHQGKRRSSIADLRSRYNDAIQELYREIQFVGVPVREHKTAQGIPMENIYIPLEITPEGIKDETARRNPLDFLAPGMRTVVLGDPGSGKSTLVKFLALAGQSKALQARFSLHPEPRLPIVVILRRYAEELRKNSNLSLTDYIVATMRAQLEVPAERDFLEYYLESGRAILYFDGLDELPESGMRTDVRDRIANLSKVYPHNTFFITSRFVGYVNPYRFRNEGWSHYQVAPLRLPEMERFVHDWYQARIANRAERQRNIDDLVSILRNPNHTAIRDLAENPLLLTIIALVHRIEADLPDERVLLYRKCTETLLSTWHNYKSADTDGKKRGKVERRNLYRMEAIANWMQCRGSGANRERAVAPYDELTRFLTQYIEQNEPEDPDHEPDQIAEYFLTFVKERAGLLIEAGDRLYSFVHLTFQEYLTAEHIKRLSGKAGVDAVWEAIRPHCCDPRWHEVIRLLIAGYDNPDAEARLVEELLNHDDQPGARRAPLLGGLLLDGVEAAEKRQTQIVDVLIRGCCNAEDRAIFRSVWEPLGEWTIRNDANRALVETSLDQTRKPLRTLMLSLIGPVPLADAIELVPIWKLRRLDWLGVDSHGGSFARAVLDSLLQTDTEDGVAGALAYQTFIIANDHDRWIDFHSNALLVAVESKRPLIGGPNAVRVLSRASIDLDNGASVRAMNWVWTRARYRVLARDRSRACFRPRYRSLTLDWDQEGGLGGPVWEQFQLKPERFSHLLDILVDVLELKPESLWSEFLRVCILPTIPQRIRAYDQSLWDRTTHNIESGKASEVDLWWAAHHLLTDSAFWIAEVFKHPSESPATKLAKLTKDSDFHALRITHCLRDLAYGDESRTQDLINMVNSPDPRYQKFFRDAYWID